MFAKYFKNCNVSWCKKFRLSANVAKVTKCFNHNKNTKNLLIVDDLDDATGISQLFITDSVPHDNLPNWVHVVSIKEIFKDII